jgi:hypothetical protein
MTTGKSCFFSAPRYLILCIVADDIISWYLHEKIMLFLLSLMPEVEFMPCFDLLSFFVLWKVEAEANLIIFPVLLQYRTYFHAYMSSLIPNFERHKKFNFFRLSSNLQKPFVVVYPSAFPKYGNLYL